MVDHLAVALQHPDIVRLRDQLASRVAGEVDPGEGTRTAAVAAVIRVVDEPELLFIKRAEAERDPWSGHVAFPGGRRESQDTSLLETAIRETAEELSLDLSAGLLLGQLDDLAPRSKALPPIIVRPYVALVAPGGELCPSAEVASTFWVPFTVLRDPAMQDEHILTVNGLRARHPAYRVQQHLVWGMTERIVRQLLSLLD